MADVGEKLYSRSKFTKKVTLTTLKGNYARLAKGSEKESASKTFLYHCKGIGLPTPEQEVRFHPKRKWRFDFSWRGRFIAVEIEGGVFSGGRHTQGKGFTEDCVKYNEAQILGWKVYRFTTQQVISGEAINFMERVFK